MTDGFTGVIASDTRVGAPTVSVVDPETDPSVAVIVVLPVERVIAVPWLVASFVIVATAALDELHVTDANCCVLLSLNVPVAMNL